MTRWGLISDVHGNLRALHEAIRVTHSAGATHLAFLGDYLGRPAPDECARLIRATASVALVGNRDLDWRHRVSPSTRAWVDSLPTRVATPDGLLLVHGDDRLTRGLGTRQIARDFRDAWDVLERERLRLLAFGHSHYARLWRKANRESPAQPLAHSPAEPRIALDPAIRYILNVGTTGLPFPARGGPSVAVVDTAENWIELLPLQWWSPRKLGGLGGKAPQKEGNN